MLSVLTLGFAMHLVIFHSLTKKTNVENKEENIKKQTYTHLYLQL